MISLSFWYLFLCLSMGMDFQKWTLHVSKNYELIKKGNRLLEQSPHEKNNNINCFRFCKFPPPYWFAQLKCSISAGYCWFSGAFFNSDISYVIVCDDDCKYFEDMNIEILNWKSITFLLRIWCKEFVWFGIICKSWFCLLFPVCLKSILFSSTKTLYESYIVDFGQKIPLFFQKG